MLRCGSNHDDMKVAMRHNSVNVFRSIRLFDSPCFNNMRSDTVVSNGTRITVPKSLTSVTVSRSFVALRNTSIGVADNPFQFFVTTTGSTPNSFRCLNHEYGRCAPMEFNGGKSLQRIRTFKRREVTL